MITRTTGDMALLTVIAVASVTILAATFDSRRGRSPVGDAFPAKTQPSQTTAEYFPNVVLQTQEGKRVRFYDDLLKGKVVLINFMYTSCPIQCPRTTANLVKVEEALGDRVGRDVLMISVTVDPLTDTPAVLKRYSRRYGAAKPGWYFVTGTQKDLDLIRRRLGVLDDAVDKTQHTGVLVYGNEATGQWAATPALSQPKAIVRSVMKLVNQQTGD